MPLSFSNLRTLARRGELPPAWRRLYGAIDTAADSDLPAGRTPGTLALASGAVAADAPMSRRRVLKILMGLGAALAHAVYVPRIARAAARRRGRFFTRHEYATIDAATARFFPTDDTPGAREARVVEYIDRLLAGGRGGGRPFVFAGGPFSGRTPFPNPATGSPSRRFPRNDFKRPLALSRVQQLRWKALLDGSANVRGADFNDAVLGPLPGLRQVYRDGVQQLDDAAGAMFGARFVDLDAQQQDAVLAEASNPGRHPPDPRTEKNFFDVLLDHTAEGMFCPPEYGGNHELAGWQLVKFDGDSQPLGYSIYDETTAGYRERPDKPMSSPNPEELVGGVLTPEPLSPDAEVYASFIATILGGFKPPASA
jgi:gluconate 2-dehydrogenase gamma chain